jgi:hypothetical protein
VYRSWLTRRRRRAGAPDVADPKVYFFRYPEILRAELFLCASAVIVGLVAMASDPIPSGGIPVSALYAIVNSVFALRYTRRDLRGVRAADDFAPDLSVGVAEPVRPWGIYIFITGVLIGFGYFAGVTTGWRWSSGRERRCALTSVP